MNHFFPFLAGRGKSVEGRVSFPSTIFNDFFCTTEQIRFSVNINTLLDCLTMFGQSCDNVTIIITYSVSMLCMLPDIIAMCLILSILFT